MFLPNYGGCGLLDDLGPLRLRLMVLLHLRRLVYMNLAGRLAGGLLDESSALSVDYPVCLVQLLDISSLYGLGTSLICRISEVDLRFGAHRSLRTHTS